MYLHRRNAFDGLAKGRAAYMLADKMRLIDRNQRMHEAFVKANEPTLVPEDEVKLTVDSPTTTNNCWHQLPTGWGVGPWLFASVLVVGLGALGWVAWSAQPTPGTPNGTIGTPKQGIDIQVLPPDPPLK